jgi:hypothetical protein
MLTVFGILFFPWNAHPVFLSDRGATAHDSPSRGKRTDGRRSPPRQRNGIDQQGLGAVMAGQGVAAQMPERSAYQLSSSLTDYALPHGTAGHLAGDNVSIISGAQMYPVGPQSYSDAYTSGVMPGSFNEVDFAYALQRPGVVPMGESVSSSVDIGAGPNLHLQQQHSSVGSYGTNRVQAHQRGQRRGGSAGGTSSRSVGGNPESMNDSRWHAPGSLGQQMPPSSLGQQLPHGSHGSYGGPMDFVGNGVAQQDQANMVVYGGQQQGSMVQPLEDPRLQIVSAPMPQDSAVSNNLQQHLAYGNAQAILQQQHAALQQQQALLQQQQAALALQQQQLQAYTMNPQLLNPGGVPNANDGSYGGVPNASGGSYGGMNQYGQTGGGYYYVSSVDGTPMMMPNEGMPQPGLAPAYGMPQQVQQQMGGYPSSVNQNGGGDQGLYPPNPNHYNRGGMSM